MSWGQQLDTVTFPASGDLSGSQYCIGQLTTAGQLKVGTTMERGLTVVMTGVLQDKTTGATQSATIALRGISKVVAGDSSGAPTAITYGLPVVCSSNGHAVGSSAVALHIAGFALANLAAAAAPTLIPMVIHNGAELTTQ